jgi:hypothetical protein
VVVALSSESCCVAALVSRCGRHVAGNEGGVEPASHRLLVEQPPHSG